MYSQISWCVANLRSACFSVVVLLDWGVPSPGRGAPAVLLS